jgi:hypothetical protein
VVAGRPLHTPLLALLETSVGRVIARVDPVYAPFVKQPSDCGAARATAAPSSAPPSWIVAAPCEEATPPLEKK